MVYMPRYNRFNPAASAMSKNGIVFKEIAGNTSAIMLTILTYQHLSKNPNYTILFTQPIVTKPGLNRIALATPVADLSMILNMLRYKGIEVEHVYDY